MDGNEQDVVPGHVMACHGMSSHVMARRAMPCQPAHILYYIYIYIDIISGISLYKDAYQDAMAERDCPQVFGDFCRDAFLQNK